MKRLNKKTGIAIFTAVMAILAVIILVYHNPLANPQDELLKIYRREYKRRFAWIRAGKISQEAFSAWSKEAQKEKEKCEAGEISQGEFAQWLKR